MNTSRVALTLVLVAAACAAPVVSAQAQSEPSEREIIEALTQPPAKTRGLSRSISGGRGVSVAGGAAKSVPSIDLKVTFAFDSAELDNESLLTLDVLGRALSSDALRGQTIEIVGHTDAKGTLEYNDVLSQRRAAAVVAYLTRQFPLDGSRLSSRGMGERRLLDGDNPTAAVNRRVEIRNVTQTR